MNDFLNNLYSMENFTTYLIIALVVLVILFFLILFLGKKDQKLEETKRLEKLNQDGFKEEKIEPVKLETTEVSENIPEKYPDILITPTVAPVVDKKEKIEDNPYLQFESENVTPVLSVEKEKPLVFQNEDTYKAEIKEEVKPVQTVNILEPEHVTVMEFGEDKKEESIIPDTKYTNDFEVNIPEFDFNDLEASMDKKYKTDDEEKYTRPNGGYEGKLSSPQIFSSVYVNDNNKTETKIEAEEIPIFNFDVQEDDDMDLPQLKSEPASEVNTIDTFQFDSISGETYNLK